MKNRIAAMMLTLGLTLSGSAQATLIDRGSGLIYDGVLDVTWLQTGNPVIGGDTGHTWDQANSYAANLVFAGFSDWRLPLMSVSAGVGGLAVPVNCAIASQAACEDNELGYMFTYNLAGIFPGPFTGLTAPGFGMWSATAFNAGGTAHYWTVIGGAGVGADGNGRAEFGAWAVHAGDIGVVSEPTTALLLLAGVAGLGWRRSRGKT